MNEDYLKRGYSPTFEKLPNERKIPYLSQFDVSSYIEGISGGLIQGGIIKSNDGKLVIDLEAGHITYSDGITETTIV